MAKTAADGEASQVGNVAAHYNNRKNSKRSLDSESPIMHLKNFNNWVKGVLIKLHCPPSNAVVLDFCCGKAGDINKWKKNNVQSVTFVDNAYMSVVHATQRYSGMEADSRTRGPMHFGAQFIVADCFQHDLIPHFKASTPRFDIVSCQFALHYSFQTEERAQMAIHNIASHMRPGGKFVGTIPDANVLAKKLRDQPTSTMGFGNSVTRVDFEGDTKYFDKANGPFGIKYNFFLADAIDDCPEYLIHFPTLYKMCAKAGLKLVEKRNFHKFFYRHVENPKLRELAGHMKVLTANDAGMTKDEWEACFYYCAFVFEKEGRHDPYEQPPPGYIGGRQASRPHYEEDIVCFPGYGPEGKETPAERKPERAGPVDDGRLKRKADDSPDLQPLDADSSPELQPLDGSAAPGTPAEKRFQSF